MFSIRFWGVRGSMPFSGLNATIYGGNTTCIEIRADERLVIIDCGTGIKDLGSYLMANDFKKGAIDADIFLSHSHWDHLLGFPLFSPLFIPSTKLRFHGPYFPDGSSLKSIFSDVLSYKFWPIRLSEISANCTFNQLREQTLDLGGGLKVTTKYMNHPVICLGFRFEYEGKVIVTAFDTEQFFNPFPHNADSLPLDAFA
ncbi:MAG: MBL fold metallo-hydrolase, partial [Spirochaetaceae bacterium]|nr:MBL fold metallo-hydrolase [Spirochaetaceae bacterium]